MSCRPLVAHGMLKLVLGVAAGVGFVSLFHFLHLYPNFYMEVISSFRNSALHKVLALRTVQTTPESPGNKRFTSVRLRIVNMYKEEGAKV